jgi:hypothetical protein
MEKKENKTSNHSENQSENEKNQQNKPKERILKSSTTKLGDFEVLQELSKKLKSQNK